MDMNSDSVATSVAALAARLNALGWQMATAESCTGGMIAAACTDLAGSSVWFERGLVTYSNAAKQTLLGVPQAVLEAHGAVSEATALAMAAGAFTHSPAQVSVAVTGIAGPGGGSLEKPVGTVWMAWCILGQTQAQGFHFTGDRHAIRLATAQHALAGLLQRLPSVH